MLIVAVVVVVVVKVQRAVVVEVGAVDGSSMSPTRIPGYSSKTVRDRWTPFPRSTPQFREEMNLRQVTKARVKW